MQRGAASARADPKEPIVRGEATEAAMKQAGEEAPTPREARALESGEAEASSIAEATEGEAEVAEAGASRASKAEVADTGAPRTTEAEVAKAGAPRTTEAEVAEAGLGAAEPAAQDAKTEAGQASELEARSLEKSMFLRWEWDVWDQLRQQKDLLANANELLSVRSVEVVDLRLRCADMKAEAAMARERAAPLATRIQELEEELTRVADERDTFRSWAEQEAASAKAIAEQLKVEQGEHLLTKGAQAEAVKVAEASWVKALAWKEKAKGLKKEASRAAEASVAVQLWGALHTGVKRALPIVSSHYAGIDLEAVSDGYVKAKDDEKAEEEVMKLVEAAETPSTALARLFEEEVVPPTPTANAGDPEF
ncbi:uncharacterized protein [Miscanthus floridulus]|uniref:uncharacterized protein n=1 Tax=Miscanthus floridulus TaxID=154761 RepID=UPI00345AED0F